MFHLVSGNVGLHQHMVFLWYDVIVKVFSVKCQNREREEVREGEERGEKGGK